MEYDTWDMTSISGTINWHFYGQRTFMRNRFLWRGCAILKFPKSKCIIFRKNGVHQYYWIACYDSCNKIRYDYITVALILNFSLQRLFDTSHKIWKYFFWLYKKIWFDLQPHNIINHMRTTIPVTRRIRIWIWIIIQTSTSVCSHSVVPKLT